MPTTSTSQPNVPLPPGAVFGDIWEFGERVVYGIDYCGPDSDVGVRASAIQRADGRIAQRPEPAQIYLGGDHIAGHLELTAAQARQLAAALLDAADQLDERAK